MSSEGHYYEGDIAGGRWVDAQHLQPGDELLSATGSWQTVVEVDAEEKPLRAFNLTVDKYSTYFVSGDELAESVWAHNDCYDPKPNGDPPDGFSAISGADATTQYGQQKYLADDGRTFYRGHDGRFYEIDAHPPSPIALQHTDPVQISGGNATARGHSFEREVRATYGNANAGEVRFTDANGVNRRADHVVEDVDGNPVAIEAKYTDNWDNSIYNPNSPIGDRSFAAEARQAQVDQLVAYSENFPQTVYHTNSEELAAYYTQRLLEQGIDNVTFVITDAQL